MSVKSNPGFYTLRNGAPFKDWDLPPALTRVRAKPKQHPDGDRQFVKGLDHDDFGLNQSKIMNVIDSKSLERDAGGKPVSTFPHPALGAVLDHGLAAVEAACAEAPEAGIASGDVILTVLARRRQPVAPPRIATPDALRLKIEPVADGGRYDGITTA